MSITAALAKRRRYRYFCPCFANLNSVQVGNLSARKPLIDPCPEVHETVSTVRFYQTRDVHGLLTVGDFNGDGVMSQLQLSDAGSDNAVLGICEEETVLLLDNHDGIALLPVYGAIVDNIGTDDSGVDVGGIDVGGVALFR